MYFQFSERSPASSRSHSAICGMVFRKLQSYQSRWDFITIKHDSKLVSNFVLEFQIRILNSNFRFETPCPYIYLFISVLRRNPPSTVEIAAMKRLGTIVCRFFFLDGRTKALDVHPCDTAQDVLNKLADKIGLQSLEGWALYQSLGESETHIQQHAYLYDIISGNIAIFNFTEFFSWNWKIQWFSITCNLQISRKNVL